MKNFNDVTSNLDRTLERRRRMASNFEQALKETPEEMEELLKVVGKIYYSGNVSRFWDVLAGLAGADRGYGNDSFFSCLEIQKQIKEEKK